MCDKGPKYDTQFYSKLNELYIIEKKKYPIIQSV